MARSGRRKRTGIFWLWGLLGVAALGALLWLDSGCISGAIRPTRAMGTPRNVTMTVTAYCNCGTCCGWRRTWYGKAVIASGPRKGQPKAVGITASGVRARTGTIAADTTRYPFGTIIYVPGYGYGRVEDRGGAIKGDSLDLWFPSHTRARQWGRQKLQVKVWLPPAK